MKKAAIFTLLLLVAASLQATKYGLQYTSVVDPPDRVTMVVAIYESEADDSLRYYKQHQVMVGKASQALRKAGNWREYDKNHVPDKYAELLERAKKGQKDEKAWEPWIGLLSEDKILADGPMPDSDEKLYRAYALRQINSAGGL